MAHGSGLFAVLLACLALLGLALSQDELGVIILHGKQGTACVALTYAVERGNLAGLVMLAPGHNPAGEARRGSGAAKDTPVR